MLCITPVLYYYDAYNPIYNMSQLKEIATLKVSDPKCKPLLNHAICHKPGQNQMKNMNVTDFCEYRELKAHFRLYEVTQP